MLQMKDRSFLYGLRVSLIYVKVREICYSYSRNIKISKNLIYIVLKVTEYMKRKGCTNQIKRFAFQFLTLIIYSTTLKSRFLVT